MPFAKLRIFGILANDRVFHNGIAELVHDGGDGKDESQNIEWLTRCKVSQRATNYDADSKVKI